MAAARHPVAYAEWGVPDTLDGRFDMITLHTFLVLDRLKGEDRAFRQELVDEFFRDMDRSLREMGVGDLSVGKKVRKMAEVFYGRLAAYDKALAGPDGGAGGSPGPQRLPGWGAATWPCGAGRPCAEDARALAAKAAADIMSARAVFEERSHEARSPVEFSRPLQVDRVPSRGSFEKIAAEPRNARPWRAAWAFRPFTRYRPRLRATPWRGGGLKLEGRLTADLEQVSVISLETFRDTV